MQALSLFGTLLCDKWIPVKMAWRVLRLRIEGRPPIWRVADNILNNHLRTADKGWFSSLGVGRDAKPPHRKNVSGYEMSLGPGLILWYDVSNGMLRTGTGDGHL